MSDDTNDKLTLELIIFSISNLADAVQMLKETVEELDTKVKELEKETNV